jgi:hypothetical protein
LPGEHELGVGRPAGDHPPLPEIIRKRRQETNGAVLPRLGVGLLAKRDRPLDQQGLLTDISPTQTERFTGTKPRIREDGDERRVAGAERCTHRLDPAR